MRLGSLRRQSVNVDEENPYWISFSDIMSGLLVVFILASLALIMELTQRKEQVSEALEELAKAEEVRRDIVHELKAELAKRDIQVEVVDNDSVVRIPDDQLTFSSDKYQIDSSVMLDRVHQIGMVLHETVTKNDRASYLDTVFVEGHTDSQNSRAFREMGNWALSTYRAIWVWKYWNEQFPAENKLESLVNHAGQPLFSVSGYAAQRRIEIDESTDADRRKNRRIDIRFTVKRPRIETLHAVKDSFDETLKP